MKCTIAICFALLSSLLSLSSWSQTKEEESRDKESNIEVGFGYHNNAFGIEREGMPPSVLAEAANPSIFHFRSGSTFGVNRIGAFDPGDNFTYPEGHIFVRFTAGQWRVRPFVELGYGRPLTSESHISTNQGENNDGYTYFKLLGSSGVDYVGYWFGIDVKSETKKLIPAVGFTFGVNDSLGIVARVHRQEFTLRYEKGIEAFGRPEGNILLGESHHTVDTYSVGARFFRGGELLIEIGPEYKRGTNGISSGFGLQCLVMHGF